LEDTAMTEITPPPATLDELHALLDAACEDNREGPTFVVEAADFMEALLYPTHPHHARVVRDLRDYLAR
jgi:hypothetical protein